MRSLAVAILTLALCSSCDRGVDSRPDQPEISTAPASSATPEVKGLRDGDVIFQESTSSQSEMVRALTRSRWTHMGVILVERSGPVVLEAASPVRKTPFARWVEHGRGGLYVVKRLKNADVVLSPETKKKAGALVKRWLGLPYDVRFRWDDQSLYCSELVYKLFDQAAGVRLGELEQAADMNLDDERVQKALKERFAGTKFDPDETVVTPDSIFNDEQLAEVRL
jgi:hypothetical protein